jgi:hypothetical protein
MVANTLVNVVLISFNSSGIFQIITLNSISDIQLTTLPTSLPSKSLITEKSGAKKT